MTKTIEQLIIENEELHSRLVETQETLMAIRSGDVDAIMVSGKKGEQVYTISSAETPYRIFVEEMNEGAITLSKEGIIIYCNQKFAELVSEPIERVIGSYLKRFISPNDKSKLDHLLAKQTHHKNEVLIVSLNNTLYLKLSFHLLPSYLEGENCIVIATDITDMKKKEKELLELQCTLKHHLEKVKGLRIDLIDTKIEAEIEINQLKKKIKELFAEIDKLKQIESELRQKIKMATT